MIDEHGNSVITVKKQDLLTALKKNLETHRATFLDALEGYKASVIEELELSLKEAKAGKRYRKIIQFEEPWDHTKEYKRVIAMLEMSISEEVKISEMEFAQYVLDDWGWKEQFATVTSGYAGKGR